MAVHEFLSVKLHLNWSHFLELLTLPEHLSSLPVFSGIRVARSLVLYVCFVDRCLFSCPFSFGHCVVCSSSIYGFWIPLWCLQALLPEESYRWSSDLLYHVFTAIFVVCIDVLILVFTLLCISYSFYENSWHI